ncbi:MAG: adenine phosphoribosyltransferase [Chloroflexi bacterium]|nr:adenine phosphoribosyltransferase [Chloroflexota bacterium]MCH8868376.1 adenine phosphoribosyltransferase [Chloroflexota bacterium]MCH9039782.1 adenine phosphoribosyltransferase [Chloroflexota bacterium]MCI0791383.1 adenine phosphoribosyltransferase [Chloroflexota bacterium]MCI0813287.1 adenine phosphoribosyltransferase [Chloroflexota bacterium]
MDLRDYIRDVPDFPRPGILFKDITPLLSHPPALRYAIKEMGKRCAALDPDTIVCIEARGFLFAAPMAYEMGKPLVPIRKRGKLPYKTLSVTYDLEYGTDTVEVHVDAISEGDRVVIVDDLLATGGTMAAAARLVEQTGGEIAGLSVLIELSELNGRAMLGGYGLISLIEY